MKLMNKIIFCGPVASVDNNIWSLKPVPVFKVNIKWYFKQDISCKTEDVIDFQNITLIEILIQLTEMQRWHVWIMILPSTFKQKKILKLESSCYTWKNAQFLLAHYGRTWYQVHLCQLMKAQETTIIIVKIRIYKI